MDIDRDQLLEGFQYLDELRESGVTNMFGAPTYMERELGYERQEAVNVWTAWKDTFDGRTVEQRVDQFIADNS